MHTSDNGRTDGRDLDLVARLDRLYVAVVSDCLDKVGIRDNVMAPHIRPLTRGTRTAGFAATVLAVQVDEIPDDPYAGEIRAVDAQQPGDVMIVSTCTGSYWGELLATASRARGAVESWLTRTRGIAGPNRDGVSDVRRRNQRPGFTRSDRRRRVGGISAAATSSSRMEISSWPTMTASSSSRSASPRTSWSWPRKRSQPRHSCAGSSPTGCRSARCSRRTGSSERPLPADRLSARWRFYGPVRAGCRRTGGLRNPLCGPDPCRAAASFENLHKACGPIFRDATKVLLENNTIWIWDLLLSPGYRRSFHCHCTRYRTVCTEPGRGIQRLPDGTMTLWKYAVGEVDYLEASPESP